MRRDGEGVAGFRYKSKVDKEVVWAAESGILQGAAGIGLSLLAATTSVEPAWDGMLLTSIRPKSLYNNPAMTPSSNG